MKVKLRNPAHCSSPALHQASLKRLSELKKQVFEEEEPVEIEKLLDDPQLEAWFEQEKAPPTKGE